MEQQNQSTFFDLVMQDFEIYDWPMTRDELETTTDSQQYMQVGYEDMDGNLRDGNGNLTFVRRLTDVDEYLSFDEVRPYEGEYMNFLNDQPTQVSYERFLELHGLPHQEENMLDRITLYSIDPVKAKEKEPPGEFECPICYESACLTQRVVPSCKHEYCKTCMLQHLDSFQSRQLIPHCALCRQPYSYLEIFESNVFHEVVHCVRREV